MRERPTCNNITYNASENYFRAVVKQLNVSKEDNDNQSKKIITGLIKIASLIKNRTKQSDTRLDSMMSQNIAHMFRDINKQ